MIGSSMLLTLLAVMQKYGKKDVLHGKRGEQHG